MQADAQKLKNGVIEEALVETIAAGMTHSAAMAAEVLQGKTIPNLKHRPCLRPIKRRNARTFLQIVYGRSQTAFSEDGLPVGASLEDLGKNLRSQVGTMFGTKEKGVRYLEMTEGYVLSMGLDENNEVIGYKFINLGKMLDAIKSGVPHKEAYEAAIKTYGRYDEAAKYIDPRKE